MPYDKVQWNWETAELSVARGCQILVYTILISRDLIYKIRIGLNHFRVERKLNSYPA